MRRFDSDPRLHILQQCVEFFYVLMFAIVGGGVVIERVWYQAFSAAVPELTLDFINFGKLQNYNVEYYPVLIGRV